jgi:hypothetical protein
MEKAPLYTAAMMDAFGNENVCAQRAQRPSFRFPSRFCSCYLELGEGFSSPSDGNQSLYKLVIQKIYNLVFNISQLRTYEHFVEQNFGLAANN